MKLFTICLFIVSVISCNTDCKNNNPIFNNNLPESRIYQEELIHQLTSQSHPDPSYHLSKYVEKHGETFLYLSVQDDNLCATAVIKVINWDSEIENIRRTKGKGYYGAGLKNLQFNIIRDSIKTELIYKDIDYIID